MLPQIDELFPRAAPSRSADEVARQAFIAAHDLDKLFAQVDKDGDGELDLDEVRKVSGSPLELPWSLTTHEGGQV